MNIDGPFLWFLFYSFHCPNLASPSKTSKRLVWQTAGGKNVNYTAACLFSAWCQHLCFGINWTEGLITGYSVLDYRSEGEIIVAFSHAGRSGGEKYKQKLCCWQNVIISTGWQVLGIQCSFWWNSAKEVDTSKKTKWKRLTDLLLWRQRLLLTPLQHWTLCSVTQPVVSYLQDRLMSTVWGKYLYQICWILLSKGRVNGVKGMGVCMIFAFFLQFLF